jgi:aspartyl-tRNA(Asn)/glutamyl-tRNA(Gln) amidotransferase subunit C
MDARHVALLPHRIWSVTQPTDTTLLELAELARLDVTSLQHDEQAGLRAALDRTTSWVAQLMAVSTDGVPQTVHPIALPTVMRADVAVPNTDSAIMLALAPDRQSDWYRVPRVVARGTDGDALRPGSQTGDD